MAKKAVVKKLSLELINSQQKMILKRIAELREEIKRVRAEEEKKEENGDTIG